MYDPHQARDTKFFQVYRHFDSVGNLLYVGRSLSAVYRLAMHKHKKSEWYGRIAKVTIENCDSFDEMCSVERVAIIIEHPLFNKVHKANGEAADAK